MNDKHKPLVFALITGSVALATVLLLNDAHEAEYTAAPNPALATAGLPQTIKEQLTDQIRMDNTTLMEVLQTIAANRAISVLPDGEQTDVLSKHIEQTMDKAARLLNAVEEKK